MAWIFAIGVLIQVYLAGQAVLGGQTWELHRNWGYLFGILSIVLIVLALAGRMPRLVVLASIVLLGLMALQSVFVILRADQPMIAAIHPVSGFLIVALAFYVAWTTLRFIRAPLPVDREAEAIARRQAELAAAPTRTEPPDEERS